MQCDGQQMNKTVLTSSNQWAAVTFDRLTQYGAVFLYVNGDEVNIAPAYALAIAGPLGTTANYTLYRLAAGGGGSSLTRGRENVTTTINASDQIALVVDHTANTIGIWRNGVLVTNYTLSASGRSLTRVVRGIRNLQGSREDCFPGSGPNSNSDVGIVSYLEGVIVQSTMALVYTTLVSDSFNRPDENPLNSAVWTPSRVARFTDCQPRSGSDR